MKKLLSLLLVLLLCVSAMPSVVLAGDTTDGNVFTRVYVPGTDVGGTGNGSKISVTTTSDGSEQYYLYESLTGASDAPLGYKGLTSYVTEITFMLTDTGSSLGFMPTFYDADKDSTDKYSYTSMLSVSESNGVVITNISDATSEKIFNDADIRWASNKLTLIPNVTMNEKHTIRIEHDPDNLRFTVWFDSNKIDITENAASALVESTVTSDGATNAKGPRFLFPATKGQTFRVYDMYIRGTQNSNTDTSETVKVFSGAREYTFAGDNSDNLFSYYVDSSNNAVITGFKYGEVPTGTYTADNPLVFPSSIGGHTVTAIADYAFNQDADGNKTKDTSKYTGYADITAIKLPNTLKTIGLHSMVGFKNISELIIPDNVELIDDNAFYNVYNKTNKTPKKLILGNSLKTIGNSAFYNFGYLGAINEIVIPASVETIESSAFVLCPVNTVIFEGAPTLGSYIFRNITALNKVVFLNDSVVFNQKVFGITGSTNNEVTVNDGFVVAGSSSVYDKVKADLKTAGFTDDIITAKIAYEDIYVYKSASIPSVYYWGTDDDATLIKAQYNKSTKELASCVPVTMTAGNSYALELENGTYDVKNMFWSMNDCKPLIAPVEY